MTTPPLSEAQRMELLRIADWFTNLCQTSDVEYSPRSTLTDARKLAAWAKSQLSRQPEAAEMLHESDDKQLNAGPMQHEASAVEVNLATMLKRMCWMIDKQDGDGSLKVLSGKAKALLTQYGLSGSALRVDAQARALSASEAEVARLTNLQAGDNVAIPVLTAERLREKATD